MHDGNAVAQAENFRQLRRDQQDGEPAPGKLVLSGPKVKTVTLNPTAAGEESIAIRPTGKALASLRKRGKVSVRVKLVFIPTGGTPSTTGKTVVLIEK